MMVIGVGDTQGYRI